MLARLRTAISGFSFPSVAEVERDYLNASVSIVDLERRMREVERGLFRRSHFDM